MFDINLFGRLVQQVMYVDLIPVHIHTIARNFVQASCLDVECWRHYTGIMITMAGLHSCIVRFNKQHEIPRLTTQKCYILMF